MITLPPLRSSSSCGCAPKKAVVPNRLPDSSPELPALLPARCASRARKDAPISPFGAAEGGIAELAAKLDIGDGSGAERTPPPPAPAGTAPGKPEANIAPA